MELGRAGLKLGWGLGRGRPAARQRRRALREAEKSWESAVFRAFRGDVRLGKLAHIGASS